MVSVIVPWTGHCSFRARFRAESALRTIRFQVRFRVAKPVESYLVGGLGLNEEFAGRQRRRGGWTMSYIDLQQTLSEWPYEPDKISVRKILAADDAVRIQMRVELGILQMEAEGRPDGARPHGSESLLAYHQKRLAKHQERNGTNLGFGLSRQECHMMRIEASLYYRRYIAYFVLEEFDSVLKDTQHSLGLFDMCHEYGIDPEDRTLLEEFRPYVLMMNARAMAYHALEDGEAASALAHVNRGVLDIKAHFEAVGRTENAEGSEEIKILRTLAGELRGRVPQDSVLVARKALRAAIEQEKFEEAARLRDELKTLATRKKRTA